MAKRAVYQRPALASKFQGCAGHTYTVQGKGGKVREVIIPPDLATQLESLRLAQPVKFIDRGVHYLLHYNISGGKTWSSSFSSASLRVKGWPEGAHGLCHSYA